MRTRALKITALAAAAALMLAACGNGDDADDSTSPANGSGNGGQNGASPDAQIFDVSGIEVDESLAALLPEGFGDTLTIGTNFPYAPMQMLAADGVTPIGFDMDMARAIGAVLGLQVDIQAADFSAIIPSVEGGLFDLGISAFTVTAVRMETVTMISYFNAGSLLAVQAGNPAGVDPDNLCGLTVGAQANTIQHERLLDLNDAGAPCADDTVDVRPFDSAALAVSSLEGGIVDAVWADAPVTYYAVHLSEGSLETLGQTTYSAPMGIVVAQDATGLADAVQGALVQLIDLGYLGQIADSWGIAAGLVDGPEINPTLS